jgi:2-amino-4-hydroxy-6-hydroxymethyldihydropteridine pyrophosphokinase
LAVEGIGPPRAVGEAALAALAQAGVGVAARSRWFESAPVPASDQPWFVNAVARVATGLAAEALLTVLHRIEADLGRIRRVRNEARVIDLDLLAYGELVRRSETGLVLPHPRLHERAFVLLPLLEVAPDWRHPVLRKTAAELALALPAGPICRPLP